MVGAAGAAVGADNKEFVNRNTLLGLVPQLEVYATLALSPLAAAVFNVYFILTIREVNDPESTTAFVPNTPTKDHSHPVALPVNAGAV
jgi:hypothetical protein